MANLMVNFKTVPIDGRIFGFEVGTEDRIKHGITERTDMCSLIGSS